LRLAVFSASSVFLLLLFAFRLLVRTQGIKQEQRQSSGSKTTIQSHKRRNKGNKGKRQRSKTKGHSQTSRSRGQYEGKQRLRKRKRTVDKHEQRQGSGQKKTDPQPYHREVRTLKAWQLSGEKGIADENEISSELVLLEPSDIQR